MGETTSFENSQIFKQLIWKRKQNVWTAFHLTCHTKNQDNLYYSFHFKKLLHVFNFENVANFWYVLSLKTVKTVFSFVK